MPDILKEFYQTNQHTIALIMTPERRALQAWRANAETGRMERMDSLILDIIHDDVTALSEADFSRFCTDNTVSPAIPERSIILSFKLSARTRPQKTNIVPAPAYLSPSF